MTVYMWRILLLVTTTTSVAEAVSAPAFTTLPFDVVAKVGGTASLQCAAAGRQPLNYWWMKEPFRIVSTDDRVVSHSNGTLEFVSVTADDHGSYQCFANNSVGVVASNSALVEIATLDDFGISDGLLRVSRKLGDHLVLPCNPPRSVPEASIYWTENRVKVDVDTIGSKAMVTLSHELVLSPLTGAGAYGCVVKNEFLEVTKKRTETFVAFSGTMTQSLQILYPPTDTEVVVGGTAVFQCIAVDKVVPTIEWKKTGHSSLAHPRVYTDENGRKLVISNAVVADEGTYKCEVSKSKTASAKLTILVPPVIHHGPEDINAAIGETLSLSCNTSGVPSPSVSWFKNGQQLISGTGTVRVGLDHTLTLTGVQEGDSGAYQCRTSNKAGIALASAAVIVRGFAPTFSQEGTLKPTSVSFQDMSTKLLCSANGSPPPTYNWHFQDFPITPADNFQILQEGSLVIKNVQYKNRGKYTCIAANQKGLINQSTVLEVYVRTTFTDDATKVYGRVGERLNLTCHVRQDPEVQVTVQWNRSDGEIKPLAGKVAISGHYLVLYNVTKADNGDYDCSVTTLAQEQSLSVLKRTVHLAIQEPPSPPQNAEASQPSTTSVKLKWAAPKFDGNSRDPLLYLIDYNSSVHSEFVRSQTQTTSLSARIHGLSPYIEYQFRVIARNDLRESLPSFPSVSIQTLPDTPSSFPVNLTAVPNPDSPGDSLFVQWKPTPMLNVNGPVVGYDVEYRKKNGLKADSWTHVTVNGSRLNVSLTSLDVHSHYKLRIRVVNSVGVGPWSDHYSAWTNELPPSVPPNITRVETVNATSLQIKFTIPPNDTHNGILQGFKVWYWPSSLSVTRVPDTRLEHIISNPWEHMVVLVNLQPSTMYSLVMVAYNNAGNSPASSQVQQSTAKAKTNVVTNVKMNHDVENGQISVHWGPPEQTDGAIVNYFVTYVRVHDSVGKTIAVDGQTQEVLLKGIESNTAYAVKIEAKSSSGERSSWTTEIEFGKGLPGPLVNVHVNIVDNQPKVSWQPGTDGGSEINGYKVEYKHNTQVQWQLYRSDIVSTINEMMLRADLFDNSATGYNYRVAARNIKGFGSPTVAQTTSVVPESTSEKEIFKELWFLIAVGVVGGVLVVVFIIIMAVCCRRRRISDKVKQANKEMEEIEERFPSAKVVQDETKSSRTAQHSSHRHNPKSPDHQSENSSAAGPPAYGNQSLQIYTTPFYAESQTATATSSDVDKLDMTESEFSESTVPAHMPSFGHPASDAEDEDPASVSTFV